MYLCVDISLIPARWQGSRSLSLKKHYHVFFDQKTLHDVDKNQLKLVKMDKLHLWFAKMQNVNIFFCRSPAGIFGFLWFLKVWSEPAVSEVKGLSREQDYTVIPTCTKLCSLIVILCYQKGNLLHHYSVHSSILHCYLKATIHVQTYLSIHRPELGHCSAEHKLNELWFSKPRVTFDSDSLPACHLRTKIWKTHLLFTQLNTPTQFFIFE